MKRRQFLFTIAAASAVVVLPIPARDEYGEFLERVRDRVMKIVRREGRAVSRLEIEPPCHQVCVDVANEETRVNSERFRLVKLWLEGWQPWVPPLTWYEVWKDRA